MDPDQIDRQCDTCHELWNPAWLDGGTCIECCEIAEHGISMSEFGGMFLVRDHQIHEVKVTDSE